MGDNDKRVHETLSALMDNETSEFETLRVLKGIEQDTELRDSWHRYHLASAALRRELPPRMVDLSSRISAAIATDPAPRGNILRRALQPLSKVAVAATVAAAAVLGVQQFQLAGGVAPESAPQVASAAQPAPAATGPQFQLPAGVDLPPVSGRMASSEAKYAIEPRPVTIMQQVQPDLETQRDIQRYLNGMMKRHTEKASANASQGMLPYARLPQELNDAR
ncbi:MAG: sigma-E factor negative regulatory protein [Porticoccaceae bacterium]|jgi:sigma-E factor negative regulatory protein RseA|nr:sigma-E factor negative regulatory protein [Porticoccaceae bacterium]HLS98932.1 sigma-E factor negative regulatory protein [Porticoccaceae bacterium]